MRLGSRLEKAFKGLLAWMAARLNPAPSVGPFQWRPGLSILVLRPDRLGDFVLTVPALKELERLSGGCGGWTLVAGPNNEEAARAFFPQARVLVFRSSLFSRLSLFMKLRRGRYDLALDFHSFPFSATSAFMTMLSGSPWRVGFRAQGDYAEMSGRVFNLGVPEPEPFQHESLKAWSLLGPLGAAAAPARIPAPQAPALSETIERKVEDFFGAVGGGKSFRLGVHPTLLKEDNRWSLNRWLELIERLSRMQGLQVFVIHGKGEEGRLKEFLELMGPRSHVFTLPDNGLFFILGSIRRMDLLICNDSGLMHWGALAAPVLALFGPSDPGQWAPLTGGAEARIFRAEDRHCDSIPPLEVAQAVEKRMASPKG
ncbi:MAG TPA: glycosyltransferase family 9 protein [bacterium]|nr:glycosyltransferase family 9 protein [bacterium]